jgi:hypothetical protein
MRAQMSPHVKETEIKNCHMAQPSLYNWQHRHIALDSELEENKGYRKQPKDQAVNTIIN